MVGVPYALATLSCKRMFTGAVMRIGRGYLSLILRHCMMGAGPGAAGHRAGATGTERGMRPGGECRAAVRGRRSICPAPVSALAPGVTQ
jgi:hypothetical protein